MGRRTRRRAEVEPLSLPDSSYADSEGNVLTMRGVLKPATRRQYAEVVSGSPLSREDAWQRAVEFLFERLVTSWTIAGTEPITRQKELLSRFRVATPGERRFVREQLRVHLAENFPDMEAP